MRGGSFPSIADIFTDRRVRKASNIITDPSQHLFALLPSGRRLQSIRAKSTILCNSFFPQAIRTLNTFWMLPPPQYHGMICTLILLLYIALINVNAFTLFIQMLLLWFWISLHDLNMSLSFLKYVCFYMTNRDLWRTVLHYCMCLMEVTINLTLKHLVCFCKFNVGINFKKDVSLVSGAETWFLWRSVWRLPDLETPAVCVFLLLFVICVAGSPGRGWCWLGASGQCSQVAI